MSKRTVAGLSLVLALLGAQQSACAQATVPVWREMTIYPADSVYPAELVRRGVQGEATVEVTLDAHGRRSSAVRATSRSAELDAIARQIAERTDAAAAGARSGLVKILFRKDHASTLASKTCADFNVDAAYQAAVFPERDARSLPVMIDAVGMLIYSLARESKARSFPAMTAVIDAAVTACARKPEAGMMDVMRQEALKLLK